MLYKRKGVDNELLNNLKTLASTKTKKDKRWKMLQLSKMYFQKSLEDIKRENLDVASLQENINNLKIKNKIRRTS